MPKFVVTVTRDTTESVTVEIEAGSPEEAEKKAVVYSHDNPNLIWEQDDTPNASSDHYTNGADIIE